jgi:TolC family type I secretion outer membrane protein
MIIRSLTAFFLATSMVWASTEPQTAEASSVQEASTREEGPQSYFAPNEDEGKPLDAAPVNYGVAKTLHDALKAAYEFNPAILQARRELLATQEGVAQAYSEFLPKAEARAGISKSQTMNSGNAKSSLSSSSGTDATRREGSLVIAQNLFKGGASFAAVRSADSQTRAMWSRTREIEQAQLLQVIEMYLELIRLKAERNVLEANRLALQTNLDFAESKLKIGEETRTQVAIAQSKLADADARLQESIANYGTAEAAFYALTGLKASDELEKPSVVNEVPKDVTNIVNEARTNNPSVINATYGYDAARADIERNRGEAYAPSVDLEASTSRGETYSESSSARSDINTRSRDNATNNQIKLGVTYKLFDGGISRSKDRQLHQNSAAKRVAIDGARMKAHQDAVRAWQSYQAAIRNIQNYRNQVDASTISLEGTKQEMAVGTKILVDVLNRQSEVLDAQLNLVKAEKAALLEGFKVLAAMGRVNEDLLKLPVKKFDPEAEYKVIIAG